MFLKKKKGFIGSIGDDLPSLIPLFFALMIFFAGLAFAFTTISDRSATINTYIDSLNVAKTALGNGSFVDIDDFKKTQENLVTMSNYFYGLVYLDNSSESNTFNFDNLFEDDFEKAFIQQCGKGIKLLEKEKYIIGECDEEEESFVLTSYSVKEKINDEVNILEEIKYRKYFYYMYPVNLLTPNGYIIVYLVVMVW